MTIDKSIEILDRLPLHLKTPKGYDNHLAVRLGIEALELVKKEREYSCSFAGELLLGETKE